MQAVAATLFDVVLLDFELEFVLIEYRGCAIWFDPKIELQVDIAVVILAQLRQRQ